MRFIPIIVFLWITAVSASNRMNLSVFNTPDSLKKENTVTDSSAFKIPDGLTGEKIIDNYIAAIGGKKNLDKVEDRTTVMKSNVKGKSFTITVYQKVPNLMRQEIDLGTFKQNVYFDGKEADMKIAGKKLDVKGKEFERLKFESMLHFLTNLDSLGIKVQLQGADEVSGKEAYEVAMTLPSGSTWIQYYDPKTWLKVKESKEIVTPQGTFVQDTYFSNYKNVDGIKYPFSIKQVVGVQQIDFDVDSIKVNSGLSSGLFEQK